MSVFASKLSTNTDTYAANRQEMLSLMDDYHDIKDRARTLSEKRRARFEERGQLTPRERRTRLLDPGMPYLELTQIPARTRLRHREQRPIRVAGRPRPGSLLQRPVARATLSGKGSICPQEKSGASTACGNCSRIPVLCNLLLSRISEAMIKCTLKQH